MGRHTKEKWLAARKRRIHNKGRFPPYHGPPGRQAEAPEGVDAPEDKDRDNGVVDHPDPPAVPAPGLFEEPTRRFEGVSWSKASNKWLSRISVSGNRVSLGRFDSFEDAVAARKRAEVEFGFTPPLV